MLAWACIGEQEALNHFAKVFIKREDAYLKATWIVTDNRDMPDLSFEGLDCLYIGTCARAYDLARKAIQAGLCVLLEDITSLTMVELRSLCDLAKDMQVPFLYHHHLVYAKLFEVIDEHIKDGLLGTLTAINVSSPDVRRLYEGLWLGEHYGGHCSDYERHENTMILTYGDVSMTIEKSDAFRIELRGEKGSFIIKDDTLHEATLYVNGEKLTCNVRGETLYSAVDACHETIGYLRTADGRYAHECMLRMYGLLRVCQKELLIIGLTGGIACGKSTVSAYLTERGYPIIDADALSHEALASGTNSYQRIVAAFDVLDEAGGISRAKLGAIVFQDEKKRRQLEEIIHPYVREKTLDAVSSCASGMIFLDVPLLYEAHFDHLCDKIIVVGTTEDMQILRLKERNSLSAKDAAQRIAAQMPLSLKRERADYYIDNSYDLDCLYGQVDHILEEIAHESL